MSRSRNRLIIALVLSFVFAAPLAAPAQEKQAARPDRRADATFAYTSQDRRDPFEPVYLSRQAKRRSTGSGEKEGYQLEELKLVGTFTSGTVRFAMMEDMQGRGLFFKRGDFINKNLWVLDMLEDRIILGYRLKGDVRKLSVDIPRKQEGKT